MLIQFDVIKKGNEETVWVVPELGEYFKEGCKEHGIEILKEEKLEDGDYYVIKDR